MPKPHILIVGAGIVGLLLAQALKKEGIPFTVFERDPNPDHRGKGWGLTIHWALDTLLSLLPQHIVDRLPESYVNPEAVKRGENGNFLFYDLSTGEAKWQVPAARRIRVSRERLRRLLMEGIEVQVCVFCRCRHATLHLADSDSGRRTSLAFHFRLPVQS